MQVNDIMTLVGNLFFPIVACIYLAKQNEKWVTIVSQVTETLKAMEVRLADIENQLPKITKGENEK